MARPVDERLKAKKDPVLHKGRSRTGLRGINNPKSEGYDCFA